jgi:hypothetical protein
MALLGAAALSVCVPAFAADVPTLGTNNAQPPAPGTLNYVQGTVLLDGNQVNNSNAGSTELTPGQVLRTRTGKAEVLLDPGVYLRLDDHSQVRMLSTGITPTQFEVEHGRVGVEVDQLFKQNVLLVVDNGVTTQLVKTGYYEFNANSPMVKVFSGRAEVQMRNGAWKQLNGRHEMALAGVAQAEATKFQPNPNEDTLMDWSKLRSQYLAEANRENNPYYHGYGPGWGPWYGGPFGWGWGPGWGWRWGWGFGW